MKITFPLVFLLLLVGCATSDFVSYVGEQKDWPVSTGAFASQVNGIAIYHSLPNRPYEVIGKFAASDASDSYLSTLAKRHKADAVVISKSQVIDGGSMYLPGQTTTYGSGSIYGNSYYGSATSYSTPGFSMPVTEVITAGWLIKFKTAATNLDLQPIK